MAKNLTKMVDSWRVKVMGDYGWQTNKQSPLYNLLKAMAAEIEANSGEIEKLKESTENPYLLNEEEIQRLRQTL